MNALHCLVLMTGAIGASQPALAQVLADPPVEWRLGGARSTMPAGPGRVKEVTGILVSDSEGKQIRFEAAGRVAYVVPYERITAMHYEESHYPQRILRRSSFYLTVHYSDVAGRPAFETIRLLSEREALSALATLERDTGGTFDRSVATQSFQGIPIRAGIGARVAVTDQTGRTMKGAIAQLSASSLTLDESTGVPRVFDQTSLLKIRLLYSAKHDALAGFAFGATVGAVSAYLTAGLSGCFSATDETDCHVAGGAAATAGVLGGLGAVIGMTIGALRYPFNDAFDVYRGSARSTSRTPAITIAPQLAQARKGVLMSVRF